MATTVVDIKAALINKLSGVGSLNGVYPYQIAQVTGGNYPFATITLKDGDGVFADTIRNKRKFRFQIDCFQERTVAGQGEQKAEVIVEAMLDEILTAFDNDTTLSGLVKWVTPVSFNANYVDREVGDTRFCQVIVEAYALVSSIT